MSYTKKNALVTKIKTLALINYSRVSDIDDKLFDSLKKGENTKNVYFGVDF